MAALFVRVKSYGSIGQGSYSNGSTIDESAQSSRSVFKKAQKARFLVLCLVLFLLWVTSSSVKHGEANQGDAIDSSPKNDWLTIVGSAKIHQKQKEQQQAFKKQDDTKAYYYFDQIVDHSLPESSGTFGMRYLQNKRYWQGPGHPILVILGGEAPLERILYPFVSEILARRLGAITYNTEHRYFGESFPVQNYSKQEIARQIAPRQTLLDTVEFIQSKRLELGCDLLDRSSPTYCPVMTVGASYSGLLSTLMRKEYPDVVDMAYAGSPCLFLFDHRATPYVYYEYITQVAESISPGCPNAVRDAIAKIRSDLESIESDDHEQLVTKASDYGICPHTLPNYIQTGSQLARKIIDFTSSHFADTNMDYYPPTPDQPFFRGCTIFQDTSRTVPERVRDYIALIQSSSSSNSADHPSCYDLSQPTNADLWDAVCCYLVPMIGKSNRAMWPASPYRLEDDIEYCERDYGITLDPYYLNKEFHLEDLSNVTRLILTNGVNDGWYPLSHTKPIPGNEEGVVILNMDNGAHHSDLTHQLQRDTADVELVHSQISNLIESWLLEIQEEK